MTSLSFPLRLNAKVRRIFSLLNEGGAADVLIVGGFVRDQILGRPSKDIDIEVYGLSFSEISQILSPYFSVNFVGQSFGVLKVDQDIDVSLPRRESKQGLGHKGFCVQSAPNLSPQEAFARRDFTINAIGLRLDGSCYDPFDGIGDLKRKKLRATSSAFKDDPLRVLRGMQFASRFDFSMEPQTVQFCRELLPEFATLSEERIYEEWKKWATKSVAPQNGLRVLQETGWIDCFPELAALVDCPQNPRWHPEGDVFSHTQLVCFEMCQLIQTITRQKNHESAPDVRPSLFSNSSVRSNHLLDDPNEERRSSSPDDWPSFSLSEEDQIVLMFAALGHDFGKPSTTTRDPQGEIRSYGHAEAGVPLVDAFLTRMKTPFRIVDKVLPLVREHMLAINFEQTFPSDKTVRRLAVRLEPATIRLWTLLCQSDALGCLAPQRHYLPSQPDSSQDAIDRKTLNGQVRFRGDLWLERASHMEIAEQAPKPLIQGRDLIALGFLPGPLMGELLKKAFEDQLDGVFSTQEEGLQHIRTLKKD